MRRVWIDEMRGFAILMVVLAHVLQRIMSGLHMETNIAYNLEFFINSFFMPLFFAISGYTYGLNDRKKILNGGAKRFFINKMWNLLIPYIILAVPVWGGKMIFSSYVSTTVSVHDLAEMFVNPIAFLWFIYVLFFVSVIVATIDYLTKLNPIFQVVVCLFAASIRCFITSNYIIFDRVLFYIIFYCVGILLESLEKLKSIRFLICYIILYFTMIVPRYAIPENIFVSIITGMFGSMLIITFFYQCRKNTNRNSILGYMGGKTIYIYVLHPIIINAVKALLVKMENESIILWFVLLNMFGLLVPLMYGILAKRLYILDIPFHPLIIKKIFSKKYK